MAKITREQDEKENRGYIEAVECVGDSSNDEFHFKGIFVDILQIYQRNKKRIKVSSFTHKNYDCTVVNANSRYVILKSTLNNKLLYLAQTSVKDIEEI